MIHRLQRFVVGTEACSSRGELVPGHRQLFVEGDLEGVEGEAREGSQREEGSAWRPSEADLGGQMEESRLLLPSLKK